MGCTMRGSSPLPNRVGWVHSPSFPKSFLRLLIAGPVSLHTGSPLGDRSPSHCACVILRHCRLLSIAKPRAHASQRQIRFQSWRKATKASFLKTKKMSQWIKQMRWRIKKSLPSFVSYVDVEPYAVSRLQHNIIIKYNIKYTHIMR